ncbi:MAG: MFS transporter [Sphingobium sp.]
MHDLSKPATTTASEWRLGWTLLVTSLLGVAISTAHIASMGVMIGDIEAEFGWSRSQITSGLALVSVISVVLAPFVGMLIDWKGPRVIGLIGIFVYGAALAALAAIGPQIWLWWAGFVGIAAGSLFVKPTVWTAAVSVRFVRHRGFALAIVLSGAGLGSALWPVTAAYLTEHYGWRIAYLGLSAIVVGTMLPLVLFFFHDGREAKGQAARAPLAHDPSAPSVREALLSFTFLRMATATLLTTGAIYSAQVHFAPIMMSMGGDRETAALVTGMFGISAIVARLVVGFLLDHFSSSLVGGVAMAFPVPACLLMLRYDGDNTILAVLAAAMFGLALGAVVDVIAFLTARNFGLKIYGTVFGTLAGLLSLGAGMGPQLASILYDATHGYHLQLWLLMPISAIGALAIATMPKQRPGH